ncbi:MAG: right-handed parallel beta-helix repeat-containing protein [Thermoflexibacter sp.]|nr:right-handed parallel beta-helix repeat-containing protein [Thermoflexibacter sp.]
MNMKFNQIIIIFAWAVFLFASCSREITLQNGLSIRNSQVIKKSIYQLNGKDSIHQPVIVIEGEDIVVDFQGTTLQGSNDKPITSPDQFYGLGILVKGKNITIKNLIVKGFKVALMAVETEGLILTHCDFSYNYRPRLFSNQEREDVSDWMSYHLNEKDEWLRYGAGIYLKNCNKTQISNCTITNGQNGLMMTNCNHGLFYNNNFSFNSGIGIGMYRSSSNRIIYNKLDWNVRGYSHEVYQRGQDSAGILVYEQSNKNIFAYNSVTHSGDGFFLWAGQTTMDTGQGGCNDNLLYGNDFSHAPTNGVEVTFSRNQIINNRIEECNHGIWGGYSYETLMLGNTFKNNQKSIAIEHGQKNEIAYNLFENEALGIHLWSRKEQPKDWGYAQNRDVRSIDYQILDNHFKSVNLPFQILGSQNVIIKNNLIENTVEMIKKDSTNTNLVFEMNDATVLFGQNEEKWKKYAPTFNDSLLKSVKFINAMLSPTQLRGRKYIMMTEYGAYNFQYPILWLRNQDSTGKLFFEVLGQDGTWKVKKFKGLEKISAVSGKLPNGFTAELPKSNISKIDIEVEIEYIGNQVVSPFGVITPKGKPYLFTFKKYFLPIQWQVKFFDYSPTINLAENPQALANILKSKPLKEEVKDRLEYKWWRSIGENLPSDYFVTVAEGELEVEDSMYEIGVTADDGVRVYVDDKLLINKWELRDMQYDESQHYTTKINLNGKHKIRIEHFEKTGFATLMVSVNKL